MKQIIAGIAMHTTLSFWLKELDVFLEWMVCVAQMWHVWYMLLTGNLLKFFFLCYTTLQYLLSHTLKFLLKMLAFVHSKYCSSNLGNAVITRLWLFRNLLRLVVKNGIYSLQFIVINWASCHIFLFWSRHNKYTAI